jgi:hypothetical protein
MHMGLLLYFLYDESPGQRRTRRLSAGAVDLFVRALTLGKLAILRPVTRAIMRLLEDAGLLPNAAAIGRARANLEQEAS